MFLRYVNNHNGNETAPKVNIIVMDGLIIYVMWHVFQLSDSFNGSYDCYHHLCCSTGGLVRVKALLCKLLYKYLAVTEVPAEKGIH